MKFGKIAVVGCIVIMLLNGCGSDDEGTTTDDGGGSVSFDRTVMLTNWADNIIIPSYTDFGSQVAALQSSFTAFESDPTQTTLEALRVSWRNAYRAWQRVSLFEIGPAEASGLRLNLNAYPTNTAEIRTQAESGEFNFNLSSARDSKGFPAIDFLINGVASTDEGILSVYTSAETGGNYLNYLDAVIADIDTRSSAVLQDWNNSFRASFIANDGATASSSVNSMVNDMILYYERYLRAGKMGIPAGVFSNNLNPGTLEALYDVGFGNDLFQEGLTTVQNFFNGRHFGSNQTGESLNSYLVFVNALNGSVPLNTSINSQFEVARSAVGNLEDFAVELETNPPVDMLSAYDDVQALVPLLKVDMLSALDIRVDFTDADGD